MVAGGSEFGEALRDARQRRGMSQLELAARARSTAHEPFPDYVVDARWRFWRGSHGGAWLWQLLGLDEGDVDIGSAMFSGPSAGLLENHDELLWQAVYLLERDARATGEDELLEEAAALRRRARRAYPPVDAAPVVCGRFRRGDEVVSVYKCPHSPR